MTPVPETIKLSEIRELSPLLRCFRSELAEFEFEARPEVGRPTAPAVNRLLESHPIGVVTPTSGSADDRILIYGLRSFQIAGCCLDSSAPIRVRNLDGLPPEKTSELSLADIVVSNHLYADRELPLGLIAPVLRCVQAGDMEALLETMLPGCTSVSAFAEFMGRSRDTLYERERRLKVTSTCRTTSLTRAGMEALLQLHPIGVSESRRRELLYGWRSARIAARTLSHASTFDCHLVPERTHEETVSDQIADILLGTALYTLRATTLASSHHLYTRLRDDGYLDQVGGLVLKSQTADDFARMLGISSEAIHRRRRPRRPRDRFKRSDEQSSAETGSPTIAEAEPHTSEQIRIGHE